MSGDCTAHSANRRRWAATTLARFWNQNEIRCGRSRRAPAQTIVLHHRRSLSSPGFPPLQYTHTTFHSTAKLCTTATTDAYTPRKPINTSITILQVPRAYAQFSPTTNMAPGKWGTSYLLSQPICALRANGLPHPPSTAQHTDYTQIQMTKRRRAPLLPPHQLSPVVASSMTRRKTTMYVSLASTWPPVLFISPDQPG